MRTTRFSDRLNTFYWPFYVHWENRISAQFLDYFSWFTRKEVTDPTIDIQINLLILILSFSIKALK